VTNGKIRALERKARRAELTLPDGAGSEWRLSDHLGKVVVLLFLMSGDRTPVCTRQECVRVREPLVGLRRDRREVVGLSTEHGESQSANFAKASPDRRCGLLADVDRQVADTLRARCSIIPGQVPRAQSFVMIRHGVIDIATCGRWEIVQTQDTILFGQYRKAQR